MLNSVRRQRDVNVNLLEYANKSRDQGFFCDVTILAGNQRIFANRLVLSCYSPYLEGFFKFQERNFTTENTIEIETVDGKALKALIDFIYTGSITISKQNVKDLLSGAHYLQMHEVKQFCFDFFCSNATVENSLDVLQIAGLYKNEGLMNEIQQYISINFDKVLQTDDFKEFSNEELISCISNLDRSQAKESWIFQAVVTWTNQDRTARKDTFFKSFKLINLEKITPKYLEEKVLEEKLVTDSNDCYKLALNAYHRHVKKHSKDQTAKTTHQELVKKNTRNQELVKETCQKFGKRATSMTTHPKLVKKTTSNQTPKLLRLGGYDASCKVNVVYDLSNETSENYPDLPETIHGHCSLTLNDYIYCIGGCKTIVAKGVNDVRRLNAKKQTSDWEQIASMNSKTYNMGAAVYRDVIVVAGGIKKFITAASTEVYHPSIDEWQTISSLKQRRSGHALVSCDGCLYAIGGVGDRNYLSSVERLSDLKGEWINIEPMQTPRANLVAVNCDGVVYAIGGYSGYDFSTTLKTVEKYDSSTNQWKYVCDMNFKRQAHAACVFCNKIYVVGGLDADHKAVTEIECYEPTFNTWSIVGNTTEQLWNHTLVAV